MKFVISDVLKRALSAHTCTNFSTFLLSRSSGRRTSQTVFVFWADWPVKVSRREFFKRDLSSSFSRIGVLSSKEWNFSSGTSRISSRAQKKKSKKKNVCRCTQSNLDAAELDTSRRTFKKLHGLFNPLTCQQSGAACCRSRILQTWIQTSDMKKKKDSSSRELTHKCSCSAVRFCFCNRFKHLFNLVRCPCFYHLVHRVSRLKSSPRWPGLESSPVPLLHVVLSPVCSCLK